MYQRADLHSRVCALSVSVVCEYSFDLRPDRQDGSGQNVVSLAPETNLTTAGAQAGVLAIPTPETKNKDIKRSYFLNDSLPLIHLRPPPIPPELAPSV